MNMKKMRIVLSLMLVAIFIFQPTSVFAGADNVHDSGTVFFETFDVGGSLSEQLYINGGPGIEFWSHHYTIWGDVLQGDRGTQLNVTRSRVQSFPDFHDRSALARTAINFWFQRHGIW